jgi:hypothetical protein
MKRNLGSRKRLVWQELPQIMATASEESAGLAFSRALSARIWGFLVFIPAIE